MAKEGPLAARMRPRKLEEFIGQEHILGQGRLLRRAIEADQLSSLLFYGPPGTGKTTLARIIANTTKAQFIAINAVLAGVKEIREAIAQAGEARRYQGRKTILFIDEVHRFNKAQQDALLPHVENGARSLIGATTEHPSCEVNKALVSRSRIFQLRSLEEGDLRKLMLAAIADSERGFGKLNVVLQDDALLHLVRVSNGDARACLNALELSVITTTPTENGEIHISLPVAEESIQKRAVLYDKDGDAHYDTISAFIKSMRGSDPDAALYWMAKMIYGGEDPRFLFRRMLIFASEDVGLADPRALQVVSSAAAAFDYVGMPEGQFHLSQACLYLATAPKSNSSLAYFDAAKQIEKESQDEVPNHLRDGNRDGDDLGHGKGYLYPHAFKDHWVAQQYLPKSLQGRIFYQPSEIGYEGELREEVERKRELHWASFENENQVGGSDVKVSDPWLRRALESSSEQLGELRKAIFASAKPARDDLLLDLSGHSSFLTWEALRRCPSGGVWSRCENAKALETLEHWCNQFHPLNRPQWLVGNIDSLVKQFLSLGNSSLKFDVILGYFKIPSWTQSLSELLTINLREGGNALLVWPNMGKSPALSSLLEASAEATPFTQNLRSIEGEFHASHHKENKVSPIEKEIAELDSSLQIEISEIELHSRRRFSRRSVMEWFSTASNLSNEKDEKLMSVMHKKLSDADWMRLESQCLAHLVNRDLAWAQAYQCVSIVKKKENL